MTLSFWFKSTTTGTEQAMVSNIDYDSEMKGFQMTYKGSYGDVQLHLHDGTPADDFIQSFGSGINDGNWHFVAFTKNGSTIYCYLDNTKYGSYSWAHNIAYTSSSAFRIGVGDSFYGGYVDEVGLWGRALSDAELATLWNSGNGYQYPFSSSGGTPTGLIKVTSIAVTTSTGINTITTVGGQLQMIATVSPSNATNQAVIWSVTDSTGDASIDANGVLTAISNGDVIVTATAADSI